MKSSLTVLLALETAEQTKPIIEHLTKALPKIHFYEAYDGKQALRTLENMPIEVLVMSYDLKFYNGKQILDEIRQLQPQHRPPHIFIISEHSHGTLGASTKERKLYYLEKPIELKKIETEFDKIINPQKYESKGSAQQDGVMDVRFMNPFIENAVKILEMTAQTKATKENLSLANSQSFQGDISAYYPVQSHLFEGFFCLSFPEESYIKVASKMLYEDYKEINDENRDGIAELCNQIFGNTKPYFYEKFKTQMQMATPTIIQGKNHSISTIGKIPRIIVKFNTELGPFFIEVAIKVKK